AYDPRAGALGERRRLEQRTEGATKPARIAAGQIARDHGLIDFPQPALIAGQQRRGPLSGPGGGEHGGTGDREGQGPGRARQHPGLGAIAIPASAPAAGVPWRAQRRRQLHVHRDLDRAPHGRVNQFAERPRVPIMRPPAQLDMLCHGAFLRWPPGRAAGLGEANHQPEECAFSLFHTNRATTRRKLLTVVDINRLNLDLLAHEPLLRRWRLERCHKWTEAYGSLSDSLPNHAPERRVNKAAAGVLTGTRGTRRPTSGWPANGSWPWKLRA